MEGTLRPDVVRGYTRYWQRWQYHNEYFRSR